jgi:hypothetical protein
MGESTLQGGSSHNDFLQGLNWLSGRDGCSTSFWLNPWLHGRSVEEVMPNLFTTPLWLTMASSLSRQGAQEQVLVRGHSKAFDSTSACSICSVS